MTGEVTFELLGPVRAWRGSEVLDLGTPRQRALLALLLLSEGRQVSAEAIVSALWGPNAPRSASTTTRSYASRLRQVLLQQATKDSEIRSVGGGYQFIVNPARVDALDFRHTTAAARAARDRGELEEACALLRSALSRWHGPALGGLRGPYFEARRTWLEEQRHSARQSLWRLDIQRGRCEEAISELGEATAARPFDEGLWELLMLAFSRADRRADALTAYQQASRLLNDELGLEPGPALQRTRTRILTARQPAIQRSLSDRAVA
ncbi:BTAD domain-containing putative transcriptional regulator [Kribbella sp. NPDC051587]|uniref:AfsR/SARP family transcriptional regulator n=1 Tax=Kribbella sp. NPDC051587 TaxID=3364119 RepID=UPI0037B9E5AB